MSVNQTIDNNDNIPPEKLDKHKGKAVENLEFIRNGCYLVKVRGKKDKYRRFYQMDNDCYKLSYKSKKAKWHQGHTSFGIADIQEIRDGPISDVFSKSFKHLGVTEDQCFSLVIRNQSETLDLVAESKDVKDRWVKGLKHQKKKLGEADLTTQQNVWMRELFKTADRDNDESLTLKEILNILKVLNISVEYDTARQVFQKADTDKTHNRKGEDCLDMEEFMVFYQMLTSRQEIEDLFHKYNYEGKYLDPPELQDFFKKEQFTIMSEEDSIRMVQTHEPCPKIKNENTMSIDGFYGMFNSQIMDVINPKHRTVYQDMSQPLSHYFIDSSHNTYLVADQLVGDSSVEAYIRALKMGCRCVEMDCWDGDKGDPVIYHGHTLTSKIFFKDVLYAINMYAFEASEYPMILSIENHCSLDQQRLMAKYMKEILGAKLFTTELPDIADLPSPADLKGRFIVKGKKLKATASETEGDVSDEDESAEVVDEEVQKRLKIKKKEPKQKLAKELSDCIVICQSVHFIGFDKEQEKYNCKQMSSFAEKKAGDLVDGSPVKYIEHNKWQLSRIYPGGLRTDSSNYDPVPMWLTGCQIVALNYQTADDNMQMNRARFEDNGGCGYVLKPQCLRLPGDNFHPMGPYPPRMKRKFKLNIISGYQLPKKKGDKARSILDPYVQVDVTGVHPDRKTVKSNYIHNNGFHPVFNEKFEFDINVPELALVRFSVMDYQDYRSNVQVAQYALPFSSIQPGYRIVHLRTKYSEPVWGACLLIHSIIN